MLSILFLENLLVSHSSAFHWWTLLMPTSHFFLQFSVLVCFVEIVSWWNCIWKELVVWPKFFVSFCYRWSFSCIMNMPWNFLLHFSLQYVLWLKSCFFLKQVKHMVIPYMPMLVPPVNWTGYVISRLRLSSICLSCHFPAKINFLWELIL